MSPKDYAQALHDEDHRLSDSLTALRISRTAVEPSSGTSESSTPGIGAQLDSFEAPRANPLGRRSGKTAPDITVSEEERIVVANTSSYRVYDHSYRHYGDTYNSTTYNGPVTEIRHANNVNLITNEDLLLLGELPKHPDISNQWSDYQEDSRESDVKAIWKWMDASHPDLILWVHAPAGLGKSTLARHLKHELHSCGRLAAAIFMSQLPTDTWGPETMIRLIGGEIGRVHRAAIPTIAKAIRECHGASPQVLIERFIRDPLFSLGLPAPLIVVLDAVDEWRSHYQFITELQHLSPLTKLIRFIVLGRSEPGAGRFKGISIRALPLPPVTVGVLQEYIDSRFLKIEWPFGRKPAARDILRLATMANGLFIWIATVCSFLERPRTNPHNTLTAILYQHQDVGEGHILAKLYSNAIGLLFPEPEDKEAVKNFLGFILVLQEPLPLEAFSILSGISTHALASMMQTLKALQIRQPTDALITVYPAPMLFHASLVEYVQSDSIPPDVAFPISLPAFHLRLGQACLRVVALIPRPGPSGDPYLSPISIYGVKLWPYHVVAGSTPVEPDLSQAETKASGLSSLRRLGHRIMVLVSGRVEEHQIQQGTHTAMVEILEGAVTFDQLTRWAPLFVKVVQPHYGSRAPSGNDIYSLMQAVANSLDATAIPTMMFRASCLEVAVRVSPNDAEGWYELGWAYGGVAEMTDSLEPVHQSVGAHQHALDIASASGAVHLIAPYMREQARSLWRRAERMGTEEDLQKAIVLERKVLALHPAGHPGRAQSLTSLAVFLDSRFNQFGSADALDEAISLHRDALALYSVEHPDRLWSLNSLGHSLYSRFELSGTTRHLEEAVLLHREALSLYPPNDPDRPWSLNDLGRALYSRFTLSSRVEDLEEAVSLHREAVVLYPPGRPDRSWLLNSLGRSLHSHFELSGSAENLEEAILSHREALALCPLGHPGRSWSLNNLGRSLCSRFELSGVTGDLEEAVLLHREALSFCPADHPDRSFSLNNLGQSLHIRFELLGRTGDSEEALLLHREALELCPTGHTDRSWSLNNVGRALCSRFEQSGIRGDLEEAVLLHREALALCPAGHTDRSWSLDNVGRALYSRFELSGVQGDLEEAVSLHREALALSPPRHVDRPWSLNYVGESLCSSYELSGLTGELEEAILLHREALALCPPGRPGRSWILNSLGQALHLLFERSQSAGDLEEAILLQREALELSPPGHPDRSWSLNNLGRCLSSRFELSRLPGDLEEAVMRHREALLLCPSPHRDRPSSVDDLAYSLHSRFKQVSGSTQDLDEAILSYREALLLIPGDHPKRLRILREQLLCLYDCFKCRGIIDDLREAIALAEAALTLYPPDSAECVTLRDSISLYTEELGRATASPDDAVRSDIEPVAHPPFRTSPV